MHIYFTVIKNILKFLFIKNKKIDINIKIVVLNSTSTIE
jgi:hypothetical protein